MIYLLKWWLSIANYYWLVVDLWKIVRQLGLWHSQYVQKWKPCSKPPTRIIMVDEWLLKIISHCWWLLKIEMIRTNHGWWMMIRLNYQRVPHQPLLRPWTTRVICRNCRRVVLFGNLRQSAMSCASLAMSGKWDFHDGIQIFQGNVARNIKKIYPLVMTNIAMERSTIFKNGEPSISIRAIYTMAMLVITRGYIIQLLREKVDSCWFNQFNPESCLVFLWAAKFPCLSR